MISGRDGTIEIGTLQADGTIRWEDIREMCIRIGAAAQLSLIEVEQRMRLALRPTPTAEQLLRDLGLQPYHYRPATPRHASPRRAARRAHRRRLKRGR